MGYTTEEQEERILTVAPQHRGVPTEAVVTAEQLREVRDAVSKVRIEDAVRHYIVALARATRDHRDVQVGASPRAIEHLGDAVRASALLDGREFCLPDDVKALAYPVLEHRLVLTTDARIRDRTAGEVLEDVLEAVPVPVEALDR
jgi:MoxR-like ATPase